MDPAPRTDPAAPGPPPDRPPDAVEIRTPAGRGWAVPEFDQDALFALIAADECPDPAAVVMKRGNTAVVLKSDAGWGGVAGPVCWKRIRRKSWFKRVLTVVRPRRTVTCYRAARRLLAAGVATPAGLACTAPKAAAIHRPGWLLTDWVEGTEDLAIARRRLSDGPPDHAHRTAARYAAAVGDLLGRMHAAGASHRDLKPNNLLVAADPGRDPAAWVIDLDAVAFPVRLTADRRRRDLDRLFWEQTDLPLTVQARFLRAYDRALGKTDRAKNWRDARPRAAPPPAAAAAG